MQPHYRTAVHYSDYSDGKTLVRLILVKKRTVLPKMVVRIVLRRSEYVPIDKKIVPHYPKKQKKSNAQVQLISEHASKDKRLTNSTARAAPPVVVVHLCVTKCCTKKIQYCAFSLLLSITKYLMLQNLIVTKCCTKKI